MRLTQLRVRDFRNLAEAVVEPAERLTVVFGENGQGKTNLLESVYFLGALRPLRAARPAELVRFGASDAEVQGVVFEQVTTRLSVRLAATSRDARMDGKKPPTVEAYAEALKLVAFTPDDLEIAKGAPGVRRRWLDRACFTRSAGHLRAHRVHAHALKARNRLLKENAPDATLEAFDATLAAAAAPVLLRRLQLLDELAPRVTERYRSVTHSGLELTVAYASGVLPKEGPAPRDEAALRGLVAEALARRRRVDRLRGHTTVGPHADDVRLELSGRDVRAYASQGQQRACVLSLKIAEIENLRERTGRTPLLLLDDVSSELDPERNAHLLAYLGRFPGQVILTTTDPSLAPVPADVPALHLRVREGAVAPA